MTRARWPCGGGRQDDPSPQRPAEPPCPLQRVVAELAVYIADEKRYGIDIALTKLQQRREQRKKSM